MCVLLSLLNPPAALHGEDAAPATPDATAAPAPAPADGAGAPSSDPRFPATFAALLAQARVAAAASRAIRARDLYRQALMLHPDDAAARAELAVVEDVIGGRGAVETGADPAALQRSAALAEGRIARARAELLASDRRCEEAVAVLTSARTALQSYAGTAEVDAELATIVELIGTARAQMAALATAQADQARRARSAGAATRVHDDAARARAADQETLSRILSLERRQEYDLALAMCRSFLSRNPAADEVERVFNRLISEVHDRRRLTTEQRAEELHQEVLARMERDLIPTGFDGEPLFANDWALRHVGSANELAAPIALPPWHEQILLGLTERISFAFDGESASEALRALRDRGHFNLVIGPGAFTAAEQPVSMKARDMTIEHALNWVCRLIGQSWQIVDGAVYIGKAEGAKAVLALYDISDLVLQPHDQQPGLVIGYPTGTQQTTMGGGAFDLFRKADGAQAQEGGLAAEDIKDLITKAVSPETWTDDRYTIAVQAQSLLVSAPPSVHILIEQFLKSQSNIRHVLVRVEVRWIELDDAFLEEVGVDWSGSNELLVAPGADPAGFHRATADFDHSGSITNLLPESAAKPSPPTNGAGLNLASTFIKAVQLAAILRAVERQERGTILESPSVTTLNGLRATCFFGRQIAYVGGYTGGTSPANAGVTAGITPQVTSLNVGGNLDVKPIVSSDGKYVTLDLIPTYASVDFFRESITATRTFATAAPDPTTGQQTTQNVTSNNPIDIPNMLITRVATTVRIPDRGTLLIGGFGNHLEQATSTKVPFLGHIPFLGRLFGARGRYSVRLQIYLLTTVTVLNFDELEQEH